MSGPLLSAVLANGGPLAETLSYCMRRGLLISASFQVGSRVGWVERPSWLLHETGGMGQPSNALDLGGPDATTLVLCIDAGWARVQWLHTVLDTWKHDRGSASDILACSFLHFSKAEGGPWGEWTALGAGLTTCSLPDSSSSCAELVLGGLGTLPSAMRALLSDDELPAEPAAVAAAAGLDASTAAPPSGTESGTFVTPPPPPPQKGGRKRRREEPPPASAALAPPAAAPRRRGTPGAGVATAAAAAAPGVRDPSGGPPPSFRVPAGASPGALAAALARVMEAYPAWAGRPQLPVTIGAPVPTHGQYAGHCAFVSLLRSAGGSPGVMEELEGVSLLRRAAVLSHILRLATDDAAGSFAGLLGATIEAAATTSGAAGGRGGGSRRARGGASGSAAPLPPPWPAILGYLRGMLGPEALTADQYAGPLEIEATARTLGRAAVVFVEESNSVDFGGLYNAPPLLAAPAAATGGQAPPPPLVFVTTRRRHTFPVLVGPLSGGGGSAVAALLRAAVRGLEAGVGRALATLEEGGGSSGGGGGVPAAACRALRGLV